MKLPIQPGAEIDLPPIESWPTARHRFDETSIHAVRAAILARRPLLLRGEPGIGKSQLARAIATEFKVPFVYTVLDERSERDDLFYQYDAIARLAEAQVSGFHAATAISLGANPKDGGDTQPNDASAPAGDWQARLAEANFIRPGVLWWAFNWDSAEAQAQAFEKTTGRDLQRWAVPTASTGGDDTPWTPTADRPCGPVVLIDEIDKTDPSVPNGLLEGLGNQGFRTDQLGKSVRLPAGAKPPLIFITTNEERELPAAFLRRCLVLRMTFPTDETAEDFLLRRAEVQCETALPAETKALLPDIVQRLLLDRREAGNKGMPKPGAAEFLDLVRILSGIEDQAEVTACWEEIAQFTFRKHVEPER